MAVEYISFEDGVLTIRESGRIGATDALHYEQLVYEHANMYPASIVVLVDAREVEVVMPDANSGMMRASAIDNVKIHVVATDGLVVTQAANILAMRNPRRNTQVFENWQDAADYAYEQAERPAYS